MSVVVGKPRIWGVRESIARLFQERLGPAEMRRRAHHILPGFLPLLLWVIPHPHPWIVTSVVAALIVGAAFVTFVRFHCIKRESEGRNDCIVAVVSYAGSILVTLLLFAPHVEVAFLVLGVLAFGDGSATLGGMLFGGRRLPWNPKKTIVGTACFLFIGASDGRRPLLGGAQNPLGRSPSSRAGSYSASDRFCGRDCHRSGGDGRRGNRRVASVTNQRQPSRGRHCGLCCQFDAVAARRLAVTATLATRAFRRVRQDGPARRSERLTQSQADTSCVGLGWVRDSSRAPARPQFAHTVI